jgi:capsid protein
MATARGLALRVPLSLRAAAGSYRASETTRSRVAVRGAGGADRHVDDQTRARARELMQDLLRNAHPATVLHGRWLDDLGVPMPRSTTGDEQWDSQVDALWQIDAQRKRGGLDARGMHTWAGLFRGWASATAGDGDVLIVKGEDLMLRTYEAERIAGPSGGNQHQRTVGGVVLGRDGEPLRTYVAPVRAGGWVDAKAAEPVEQEACVFFQHLTRHSQTRGLPVLVAGLDDFERLDSMLESTVIAGEQNSNLFGAIKGLKSELAAGARGPATSAPISAKGAPAILDTGANPADRVPDYYETARGALLMLYDDQEYQAIQPTAPNLAIGPFMTWMLRLLSLGYSYPYELALMDLGGLSWSSSKTLVTLARAGMARWRGQVFEAGLRDIRNWWLAAKINAGLIRPRDDWESHAWDWPELPWPDPLKEEQRNVLAYANGSDSPQRVVGHAWADIRRENHQAVLLSDALAVERLAKLQQSIDVANAANKNLNLTRAEVLAINGAVTAPGAFLQAAANLNQSQTNEPPAKPTTSG